MLGEELGNLGFHSLGQKGARPATQDFGELVGEHPWLNELDDGIFGHGVSSFGGEVAGLITATIRRLHPFTPSPTFPHSSPTWPGGDAGSGAVLLGVSRVLLSYSMRMGSICMAR